MGSLDLGGVWEDSVEMKDTRLRELTQGSGVVEGSGVFEVEMKDTRSRELTHYHYDLRCFG